MKIIADIHTHTIASGHAYSTLKENLGQAALAGLDFLGVSDHTPGMPGTTCEGYFRHLKIVGGEIDGVKILKGAETNITDAGGHIDLAYEITERLDYIIASLHDMVVANMGITANTQAVIRAMADPRVRVIGHPDDDFFPLDYRVLAAAASVTRTALELNNSSLSPLSSRSGGVGNARRMLEECARAGARVMVGSDSHIWYSVGDFGYALALLEECGFPQELVINADRARFEEYMGLTTISEQVALAV